MTYLLSCFFNSIIFALINFIVVLYMLQRFFQAVRVHSKIMAEVIEFHSTVNDSRASLRYIALKVTETMNEIEHDIAKELTITDHLTKLSAKMTTMLQRFNAIEQGVIEFVRMDRKMESIKVETPLDIKKEVRSILAATKQKQEQTKVQKKLRSTIDENVEKESIVHNAPFKFSAPQWCERKPDQILPISKQRQERIRSSTSRFPCN